MLGQLLGFAIHAHPAAATLELFESLGFQRLPVGGVGGGPYAAMWDGAVALALHEDEIESPVPTFVRPDLKAHVRAFRRRGANFRFTELADDEFHRAGFLDPEGRLVVLVEARTFSPGPREHARVRACGEFLEWSVSTRSIAASERYWAALGLGRVAEGPAPHPWVRLAGHGLVLGLHETANLSPGLTFAARELDARVEYLAAKDLRVERGAPIAAPGRNAATLVMPGGTAFYLVE